MTTVAAEKTSNNESDSALTLYKAVQEVLSRGNDVEIRYSRDGLKLYEIDRKIKTIIQ